METSVRIIYGVLNSIRVVKDVPEKQKHKQLRPGQQNDFILGLQVTIENLVGSGLNSEKIN